MIDKNLFLETLHEVAEIAATSSEKIKPEEVHRYLEGMELSEEQEKMVYEYLNLPPEAKAARQPECDKAAEEEEPEVETIEVYSDTDSASGIQIGADRGSKDTIEEEEEDALQPKDVEQLSDSVYYKMYLNDVRERGEADEAKMLELYTAVLQGDQSVVNAIVDGWLMRVIHMAGMYDDVPVNMEDLIQEGMIGLFKAVTSYQEEKNTSFSTFAYLCVQRQIYTTITAFNRKKHIPLNTAISLFEQKNQEEELSLDEILETPEETPEEMMLRKEELNDYYKMLDQNLSKFEKQVMYHYLNGETYTTIAKKLGKSDKSIDNAIQRIRRKIRNDQES